MSRIMSAIAFFGFALAAIYYLSQFISQQSSVSAENGWHFDITGYDTLLQEQRKPQAILVYLRPKACQDCIAFERDYLNHPRQQALLQGFDKLQIITDRDREHARFAKQFERQATPSLFLFYPEQTVVSTYLLLEMSQIWVPHQAQLDKGNFMPLSPISFELALRRAKEKAKLQLQ